MSKGYTAEQKYESMKLFRSGATLLEVTDTIGVSDYAARSLKELAESYTIKIEPFITQVWDIETTDFMSDIGNLMVSSFLDLSVGIPNTRTIHDFTGSLKKRESELAAWTSEQIRLSDVIIGHNVKAFDRNFLSGVLFRNKLPQAPKRTYLDTMLIGRFGVKGKMGNSMKNLADIMELQLGKDAPSKNDWRRYIGGDPDSVERITLRCEFDVQVNADMWNGLREYYYEWKGER